MIATNQQQPQPAASTPVIHSNTPGDRDDDIDEMMISSSQHRIYEKIYQVAERFSSTRIGSFITGRADRVLKIIEETAKWSLPPISDNKIERPLPWLPFLMLIIFLRVTRIWVSVVAVMIGNSPVMATDLVYFIQTRRRKLRAVRMHGIKAMRQRAVEEEAAKTSRYSMSFMEKLRTMLSTAICRPGLQYEPSRRIFTNRDLNEDKPQQSSSHERSRNKRPREEESTDSEDNLTCDQLLTKYANENSNEDSDFLLEADEDRDTSANTSNTSTDTQPDSSAETERMPMLEVQIVAAPIANQSHDRSIEVNSDHQPNDMPKPLPDIKKEPVSDSENNSEQPKTPLVSNGPSNGDENREAPDVARRSIIKPARKHPTTTSNQGQHLTNGLEQPERRSSTPGHESAALMRPQMLPSLATAATATKPTNPEDNSNDESNTPTSLSSNASSSSLASFLTSDEFINVIENDNDIEHEYDNYADETKTPTPSSESTLLASASSSEDVFYSPIGSPDESNAAFRPSSILKQPPGKTHKEPTHSTPKGAQGDGEGESSILPKKHNLPKQQNQYRNRNRNRR